MQFCIFISVYAFYPNWNENQEVKKQYRLEVNRKQGQVSLCEKRQVCTICVRESIWLAVRAASSSEDSSVSSWFARFRLGVLLEHWYSCSEGVSPLSILSSERLRTPQLKLSILSPWKSKTWFLRPQIYAHKHSKCNTPGEHKPKWRILIALS